MTKPPLSEPRSFQPDIPEEAFKSDTQKAAQAMSRYFREIGKPGMSRLHASTAELIRDARSQSQAASSPTPT